MAPSYPPLGTNVPPLADWGLPAFADLALQARGWCGPDRAGNLDAGIPTTPDGWPLRDAGLFWALHPSWPAGEYAVSWKGSGRAEWGGESAVRSTASSVTLNPAAGRLWLTFRGVDANDPPRNLMITPPGADPTQTFRPDLVAALKPFRVLRFMDWGLTNLTTPHPWSARRPPTGPQGPLLQYGEKGVAWEHMLALANAAGRDPWLCLPDWSGPEYWRPLAALVKASLDPARTLYLEISNELWNPAFPQQARALAAAADDRSLTLENPYARMHEWALRRLQAAAGVFRAAGVNVRAAFCGQQDVTWHAEQALGAVKDFTPDALGFGDYFPVYPWRARTDTLDNLFADLKAGLPLNAACAAAWRKLADARGVPAVYAYEGGQNYRGATAPLRLAQTDPRMGDAKRQVVSASGADLWLAYHGVPDAWQDGDYWGASEGYDKVTPKRQALLGMAAPRCVGVEVRSVDPPAAAACYEDGTCRLLS